MSDIDPEHKAGNKVSETLWGWETTNERQWTRIETTWATCGRRVLSHCLVCAGTAGMLATDTCLHWCEFVSIRG